MANSYTPIKRIQLVREGSLRGRPRLTSTNEAKQFWLQYWRENPGNDQERFVIACLNTKHQVEAIIPITTGTLDASLVHPREVFRPAVAASAAAIMLSHNHPSGDCEPSKEDRHVTDQLTESGKLLGITVLDHIIHGDGTDKVLSIREASQLC